MANKKILISEIIKPSKDIRNKYHGKDWSAEEDVLAFLTVAELVGR